jgi:NAD(P)H-dependent FMN reductase
VQKARILVLAGSTRSGSLSSQLAALAVKELTLLDAEVSQLSLADYPMPIYDGDAEMRRGAPEAARKLRAAFNAHRGIYIATPEYNASVPPVLKNAIDWVSRTRDPVADPFKHCVFAIGATSSRSLGGYLGLMALRQVLELGCGALVLPEQVWVREAEQAFDDMGALKNERNAKLLRSGLARLCSLSQAEL